MRLSVSGPSLSLLALVLASAGCTLNTDYFSEYRGKNLLANHDFGVAGAWNLVSDATTLALDPAYTPADYMTWEPASGDPALTALTLGTGPDGVSPAYRLEIKNQVANGDFETSTEGSTTLAGAGWSKINNYNLASSGTAAVRYSTSNPSNLAPIPLSFQSGFEALDNRSLLFSAQANADQVALYLPTALGALWRAGQYEFRFDLINGTAGTGLGVDLRNAAGNSVVQGEAWDLTGLSPITTGARASAYKTFTVGAASDQFTIVLGRGQTSSDAALLDNVRIVPADKDLSVSLSFPSLNTGTLQLLPGVKEGMYTFTVQVHDDPTADQTGVAAAHSPNRFYPTGLMVTVKGKAKSGNLAVLAQDFVARPAMGWTTWTTVTLQGGLDFVDSDLDLDGQPALLVLLSPTDQITALNKDAGSLLVAQPTLTYNP